MLAETTLGLSGRTFRIKEFERTVEGLLPFVIIDDLVEVVGRIAPSVNRSKLTKIGKEIIETIKLFTYKEASVGIVQCGVLCDQLGNEVIEVLSESPNAGVIIADRYILPGYEDERIMRVNLSRGMDGEMVSRPGESKGVEAQLQKVAEWIKLNGFSEILVVDDVLAFSGTLSKYISFVRGIDDQIEIRPLVGIASSGGDWRGVESIREKFGLEVSCLMLVKAGDKFGDNLGMALPTLRDFTVFGGKIGLLPGDLPATYPYYLPFSITKAAFGPVGGRNKLATDLACLNGELIREIERANRRKLLLGDLLEAGFGIPTSYLKSQQELLPEIDLRMPLTSYLDYLYIGLVQNWDAVDEEQRRSL